MEAPGRNVNQTEADSCLKLLSLAGEVMVEVPLAQTSAMSVLDLKIHVQAQLGIALALQRILRGGELLEDSSTNLHEVDELTFVLDETPLHSWDIAGNPDSIHLSGSGGHVVFKPECGRSDIDYINVITKEPVRYGAHYFELKVHKIGDEQWFGVSPDPNRAGYVGSCHGWFYYSGRRHSSRGEIQGPEENCQIKTCEHIDQGDAIGLLLDADRGLLAFMRNGKFQGACVVPQKPLYLTTSPDESGDSIELLKLTLGESPMSLEELRTPGLASIAISDAMQDDEQMESEEDAENDDEEDEGNQTLCPSGRL